MPCHEFGIIDKLSRRLKKYSKYKPEKYNCISIDDDYFTEEIAKKLADIPMLNPCINETCYNLCYYGITIIPTESLESFKNIFLNENNSMFDELIILTDKAIFENKNIIHYGV